MSREEILLGFAISGRLTAKRSLMLAKLRWSGGKARKKT